MKRSGTYLGIDHIRLCPLCKQIYAAAFDRIEWPHSTASYSRKQKLNYLSDGENNDDWKRYFPQIRNESSFLNEINKETCVKSFSFKSLKVNLKIMENFSDYCSYLSFCQIILRSHDP